jgi:septal ring-binding cell division protein DamX
MNNTIKFIGVGICILNLASCVTYEERDTPNYQAYAYDYAPIYQPSSSSPMDYGPVYTTQTSVSVPDSYHVGEYHSPVSFKDRDRTWVSSQNPQGYTIELADDEKASQVAKKLYQAPKNDRMAQVKYLRDGKSYYKGLYGTYPSAEAAQKALDALPSDVRQDAAIQSWGSVQGNL